MGFLFDELRKHANAPAIPATPAIPGRLNRTIAGIAAQDVDGRSSVAVTQQRRLLEAIRDAGLPDATLGRDDATPGELQALNARQLRAYARWLGDAQKMDAGEVPESYSGLAVCDGCGPVWMWHGAPQSVRACPWCARRVAGRSLPAPKVRCGTCMHFLPDSVGSGGGIGSCRAGVPYKGNEGCRYPFALRYCTVYRPVQL